ncbi:MAG: lipid-A-disaccharide synthase [Desulfotignum sp.]
MKDPDRHIMILAGEPSGDVHGADLVSAMHRLDPSLKFSGIGGPCMERAGVSLFFSIDRLSAMGLTEVIRQFNPIKQAYDLFRQHLKTDRPGLLILIDYPGFNLRAARYAKKHSSARVFYYITPKVWAWNRSRLLQMKHTIDHAGLIFPFEEKLYKTAGIPATYVGNPLMDRYPEPVTLPSGTGGDTSSAPGTIGLLPGSRKNEVKNLLGLMLTAAQRIHRHHPQVRYLVSAAQSIPLDMIEKPVRALKNAGLFQVVPGSPRLIFEQADMLIAASGTITLEAAICQVPTVIIYKMSPITYQIARLLVTVRYAGLANLIVGREVMPELLQDAATPDKICTAALDMLANLAEHRRRLIPVRRLLGAPGAAKRGAVIALDLMRRAESDHCVHSGFDKPCQTLLK